MDFLNKAFEQIKDVFSQMSPGARITTGLLVVVVALSIAYLAKFESSSADNYLNGGKPFSASDLQAAEAAFAQADLNEYVVEGSRIRVPLAKRNAYNAAMTTANALPKGFDEHMQGLVEKPGFFESEHQLRMRHQFAKQADLARTIRMMESVMEATVQYAEVVKGGFPRKKERTAMVAVRPIGGEDLTETQIEGIKNLVAGAYAGLSTEDVSLTDLNSGRTYKKSESGGVAGANGRYATQKRFFDAYWLKKVREQVSMIPGAIVSVDVTLDQKLQSVSTGRTYDPKATEWSSRNTRENSTRNGVVAGGRPGIGSQGGANSPATVNQRLTDLTTENSDESSQKIPSFTDKTEVMAPLVPKLVRTAISVPTSYFESIWRQKNPTAEGEEPGVPPVGKIEEIEQAVKKKIEESVLNILPEVPPGVDAFPIVQFASHQHFDPIEIKPPGLAANTFGWLDENWSSVGMTLVGMFSLLMLRSMVRTPPTSDSGGEVAPLSDSELSLQRDDNEQDFGGDDDDESAEKRKFRVSGPNIRDELADMVREDPDAAANILRNWIGEAA